MKKWLVLRQKQQEKILYIALKYIFTSKTIKLLQLIYLECHGIEND